MNPTLYEKDYYLWLEETVQLLKDGKLSELDIHNLTEEISDMGRNQQKALKSNLIVLLIHLLKWKYQPEKQSGSWESSIIEHRRRIIDDFEDSPSLKAVFAKVFDKCYQDARRQAAAETRLTLMTFPLECPFTEENVLNPDYLPNID